MSAVRCHPDLPRMVSAVEILSPTRYTLWGAVRDLVAAGVEPSSGESGAPILPYLASELYTRLYSRSPADPPPPPDIVARRDFAVVLSGANSGTGTWDVGWRVAGAEGDGTVVVVRDGVAFWAPADEVRTRSGTPRPGEPCTVRIGKELRQLRPGFYVAMGDGDPRDEDESAPLVRLYWHLTAAGAAAYIHAVTTRLNAAGIPFRTKVVADPEHYRRADAGVLYLDRADWPRARTPLQAVYQAVRDHLRPEVPMLTRRLAPGWALAEDPGDGRSFGEARCASVAKALWSCHEERVTDPAARLSRTAELLREEGIDPLRPYLVPGSRDAYRFRAPRTVPPAVARG